MDKDTYLDLAKARITRKNEIISKLYSREKSC